MSCASTAKGYSRYANIPICCEDKIDTLMDNIIKIQIIQKNKSISF